jgi:hypothetical protein
VDNFASLPTWEIKDLSEHDHRAIEEYQTQILTILDTWKDNSKNNKEKTALRTVIKTLSSDKLPLNQQYQELLNLLNKYPNSNIKLNNLVKA